MSTCRRFIAAFVPLIAILSGRAQVPAQVLEERSVEISVRAAANDAVYEAVKGYKAILLGSMHGTAEGPELFLGLVRSLRKNGVKVVAGVELPSDGIDLRDTLTLESLKSSPAFKTSNKDGRQSIAWAGMLVELQKTGAEIVAFDLGNEYRRDVRAPRDSLMYLALNEALKKDTAKVLVTFSNNLISRLKPHRRYVPMGSYLQSDTNSVLRGKKILSLNHLYNDGEAYYWKNHGFKLWPVEGNAGFFGFAAPYDNYLFVYPVEEGYNGLIFTKTLTPSGPLLEAP
jgi:hypothetical protein